MPKTNRTDKIRADIHRAYAALAAIEDALNHGDAEQLARAAKFMEAFGCYVRRTDIGEVAS